MKNLINNDMAKNLSIILGIGLFMFLVTKTFAVSSPFRPSDQELDPSCAPGDPFCYVTRDKDLYKENASGTITNTTSGTNAIVMGSGGTASGTNAIAVGQEDDLEAGPTASGDYSVAIGTASNASGDYSVAIGSSEAAGNYSTAIGSGSNIAGTNAFGIGFGIFAPSFREVALGSYPSSYTPSSATTWSATDRLLNIGNGSSSGSRSDAFTILKNGNIGIGDSTPSYILDINSTGAIKLPVGTTANRPASLTAGLLRYNSSAAGAEVYNGSTWTTLGSGGSSGYDLVKINEETFNTLTGDIGPDAIGLFSIAIGEGVTSKSYKQFTVGSFPENFTPAGAEDWDSGDPIFLVGNGESNETASNAMIVTKGGAVGVGSGITAQDLRNQYFYVKAGEGTFGYFDATTPSWATSSDQSLKENIEDLNYGLDEVLALEPRRFNYIGKSNETIGFIAQEVEGVVPELVSDGPNGLKGLAYANFAPVLVSAIQELEARVEELENELNVTPAPKESPKQEQEVVDEGSEEEVSSEEEVVEEEAPVEDPAPEEGEGEVLGAYVDASNQMNLTNILLMAGILLLVINLIATMKKQD